MPSFNTYRMPRPLPPQMHVQVQTTHLALSMPLASPLPMLPMPMLQDLEPLPSLAPVEMRAMTSFGAEAGFDDPAALLPLPPLLALPQFPADLPLPTLDRVLSFDSVCLCLELSCSSFVSSDVRLIKATVWISVKSASPEASQNA